MAERGGSLFIVLNVLVTKSFRGKIENSGGEGEAKRRKGDCISLGIVIYGSQSQRMSLRMRSPGHCRMKRKKGLQS